jgi:alkanesulfonate monooxygenase SsuD/methylene tetrahydromethanopterin reductase-like flavin-dependent oxidoreductase (luciferase family)
MKVWHFNEMSHHQAWEHAGESVRVDVPSRLYDPVIGADLYNRYLDEWALCDELGINIMVNEHHAASTCLSSICTIPLAILARETKRVRLLALGMPVANRLEPIRVAEEFAMIDVISRGRLEMGLIKGAPYEIAVSNSNPATLMERYWEAHDLILKALTTQDGPFNWEGKYFQHRKVNVWPRPFQQPHPPVWVPAGSVKSAREIAERGHVMATFNTGWRTKGLFDAYKERAAELGWTATPDRFAYLGIVGVGNTKEEGFRIASQIMEHFTVNTVVAPQYTKPPGYNSVEDMTRALRSGTKGATGLIATAMTRDGKVLEKRRATVEEYIDAGIVFAGTPDMVFEQIREFVNKAGSLGHLLMQGQAAWLSHEDTVRNLTLFSKEVLPRLEGLTEASETPVLGFTAVA